MSFFRQNIFARIIHRYTTTALSQPSVPASSDHKDGTWTSTDIYEGEIFMNTEDHRVYTRMDGTIYEFFMGTLNGGCKMYCTSGTFTSGVVRTLNATPVTLVSAPGSGKVIEPIRWVTRVNFSTTAYTTNTTINIKNSGAAATILTDTTTLPSTISRILLSQSFTNPTAGQTQLLDNTALIAQANSGDPAAGFSSIDWYLLYRIITL